MMNRRPKTFGEGVARGAKGVGQGFYDGIAGVVFKPLAGVFYLCLLNACSTRSGMRRLQ